MKLSTIALLGMACAACSNSSNTPAPGASAPAMSSTPQPASAIPMQAPATGASSVAPVVPPGNGPSLGVILQRPGFAKIYADMSGASGLPAWAKTADLSAPSTKMQVDGKTMWLSHVCQTEDCRSGQLFLLTDLAAHTMQGLYVDASGGAGASVRKLGWLGTPDAAVEAFLRDQAARN